MSGWAAGTGTERSSGPQRARLLATAARDTDASPVDVLSGPDVAAHVVRGGLQRGAGFLAINLLTGLTAIVLLRYLGVEDFGRYGTVMALLAIVQGVSDAGLVDDRVARAGSPLGRRGGASCSRTCWACGSCSRRPGSSPRSGFAAVAGYDATCSCSAPRSPGAGVLLAQRAGGDAPAAGGGDAERPPDSQRGACASCSCALGFLGLVVAGASLAALLQRPSSPPRSSSWLIDAAARSRRHRPRPRRAGRPTTTARARADVTLPLAVSGGPQRPLLPRSSWS